MYGIVEHLVTTGLRIGMSRLQVRVSSRFAKTRFAKSHFAETHFVEF